MNQFVESLRRLYQSQMVNKKKIDELFKSNKITMDEKNYILNVD